MEDSMNKPEEISQEDDTRIIEIEGLGRKTLAEWEIEFAKALYEEFKDDPEYKRRMRL